MVEPLLDIIFRHKDRLTDIHICDCQQITVILKKYVVTVFKDSWLERFCKIFHFDTLVETVHHRNTEILKDFTSVIAEIFKLRNYIIKRIDLFLFKSGK